jgi:hypothetical protein
MKYSRAVAADSAIVRDGHVRGSREPNLAPTDSSARAGDSTSRNASHPNKKRPRDMAFS